MSCPRCQSERVETVTVAADGAWEVRQCTCCWYAWRSTEPPERTTAEHFPAEFRMDRQAIESAPELPAVPQR
ncbi:non-oxidative hydroxyarylic acid decarboxylases subunit D [Streptomyces sp. 8N114]|uniref:non-oxidative hydroxyarylic acid decarboxylases subunit D n=1 Tax=Streptomyces sp. 8N114 TaxID=3457419 RepID=UPI003FD030D3